jgi:hypothetical protein
MAVWALGMPLSVRYKERAHQYELWGHPISRDAANVLGWAGLVCFYGWVPMALVTAGVYAWLGYARRGAAEPRAAHASDETSQEEPPSAAEP